MARFERDGISLQYPESWKLECAEEETGWTVHLQSPGTAFLSLMLDQSMPEVGEMIESALVTLREDYPGLEVEERIDTLAGTMAQGHNIQFITLDLTNTCWTRSLFCDAGTLLLLCQTNDLELAPYEPVLRAICASLRIDEEDSLTDN